MVVLTPPGRIVHPSRTAKGHPTMRVLGVILLLVGVLWVFQGLGVVGGSFMTGRSEWLYIGLATAAAGAALFVWAARRATRP